MALRCSLQSRCPATSDKVLFFLALLQEMFNPTTKRFTLTVDGRPVCRKAFLIFWDIRDYTFKKLVRMSSTWKGLENSTSGLQILTELPEGHPPHIPPTPLPEEDLVDLPSLPSMPAHVQTFWKDFEEEQFSPSYGSVPAFLERDFWGVPLESLSSSSSSAEESSVERPIHVTHHPVTVNLTADLLQKNLAVRVSPDFYENSADQPDFWLAKLIDILPASSSGNRKIKVQWYQNIVSNNTNKFELLEDTDEILFSSVIWGNIELTNTGKIKKAHERKIYSLMNQ